MTWALQTRVEVDTFLVMTDNETWAGRSHPHTELVNYRQKMGIDAKLVVAGVSATEFTIADPSDRGMLDVVGFDSNAPKVIADFSAGRI
jgi:60 kDa SS-A/Ro ribonucleoprotein